MLNNFIYHEKQKPQTIQSGVSCFRFNSIWRCPTLTWGNPTLPSALQHFTSEFGMESGRTTSLWSPEYSVDDILSFLFSLFLNSKQAVKTLERCIVKPLGQLVSVSSTSRNAYTPDLSTS